VDGATGRQFFLCEDGGLIAASMDRATDRFERCLATPAAYGDACMTSLVGAVFRIRSWVGLADGE
jgi:hypothetical protein